jgi:hypothetical protein
VDSSSYVARVTELRILILVLVIVSALLFAGCGPSAPEGKVLEKKDAGAGPGNPQSLGEPKL